jgi:hypothetical protein
VIEGLHDGDFAADVHGEFVGLDVVLVQDIDSIWTKFIKMASKSHATNGGVFVCLRSYEGCVTGLWRIESVQKYFCFRVGISCPNTSYSGVGDSVPLACECRANC